MRERILVVDDDESLRSTLSYMLGHSGFDVRAASDGSAALAAVQEAAPDLILLDVMLPGIDGFELCRQLRTELSIPIVMLTARDEPVDRVVGLEVGADDYVVKPFSMRELIARVKAHLRRAGMLRAASLPASGDVSAPEELHQVGEIQIDVSRRRAEVRGRSVALKRREFDLLSYMARNAGIVLSRGQLLTAVWVDELDGGTRTVDVHIRRLRQVVEVDPAVPEYLHTARGLGYVFRHQPTRSHSLAGR